MPAARDAVKSTMCFKGKTQRFAAGCNCYRQFNRSAVGLAIVDALGGEGDELAEEVLREVEVVDVRGGATG
jgi:hypothetical protein